MSNFFHLLAGSLGLALFFSVEVAGLFLIPFGIPGTLLQAAAALVLRLASGGTIRLRWVALFFVLALVGELIDFLSGQFGAKKFGGSKSAAWGALLGGFIGAFFGSFIPIPLIGTIVASFIGTFTGAIVGQMRHEKKVDIKLRVGIGAIIGRALAVRTIALVDALPRKRSADVIGRQLLRSGTSVGANYRAACRGRSAADVLSRLAIVEEEADESMYWIELLIEAHLIAESRVQNLLNEFNQIVAMTVASIKTIRSKRKH